VNVASLKYFIGVMMLVLVPFSAQALNVAVVDGSQVIKKYQPAIDAKLKREFKDREGQLVALQADLRKMSDKLQRDKAVLSATELSKMQTEFQNKERELQRQGAAFNEDVSLRGNQEMQILLQKVQTVIDKIAADKKYDMVIQRGAAVYVNDSLDITPAVLKQLDTDVKI